MDTVLILIRQVLQMFLLVGLGYMLFRTKKITGEGSRTLANILIYLVLPCVIINSFRIERTQEHVMGLLISAGVAAVLLALSLAVSHLFFRKDAIANFASSFSNPGFFGIPLITASLGGEAIFYVAFFIAFLNILQWTYGVSLLTGQKVTAGFQPKKLVKAPFFIATAVGLVLFATGLQLPDILSGCLTSVAGLNTPLSMFTIGVYLAHTDLKKMVRRTSLYRIHLSRLAVIPLISLLLLTLLPADLYRMKLALLLAISCPSGANVAVYAQLHNKDYTYAVEAVVTSTLLSILSIPGIVALSNLLW